MCVERLNEIDFIKTVRVGCTKNIHI